ncbi:unnamed protein product [Coffea canephora]|uniref:Uncharacterized protein n=1 Tax=Coffea canephora TaxID=49390 RepID=A0A068TN80_COFCA|nr:unnamed protein product [Coffea canephora]
MWKQKGGWRGEDYYSHLRLRIVSCPITAKYYCYLSCPANIRSTAGGARRFVQHHIFQIPCLELLIRVTSSKDFSFTLHA